MSKSTIQVEMLKNYWNEDGEQCPSGSVLDMPKGVAMDLIEKGIAKVNEAETEEEDTEE